MKKKGAIYKESKKAARKARRGEILMNAPWGFAAGSSAVHRLTNKLSTNDSSVQNPFQDAMQYADDNSN